MRVTFITLFLTSMFSMFIVSVCKAQDTTPPAPPVITMDNDDISCSPSWSIVIDADANIRYNLYRCDGSNCTASSTWEEIASDIGQEQGLTYTDIVDTDEEYTYCVTATDESGNESPIYPSPRPNCKVCEPDSRAEPPTGVNANSGYGNYSVLIYWTLSPDDDGVNGGYTIYRCSDQACFNATVVSGKSCSFLAASNSTVRTLGPEAPIELFQEPAGTFYYGVTFSYDCSDKDTESLLAGVPEAISDHLIVIAEYPPCESSSKILSISNCEDSCILQNCSSISVIDTSIKGPDGKFALIPKSGLEVFLVDSNNNSIGSSSTTNSDGNFVITIDNNSALVNHDAQYKVILKIPAAEKDHMPCDSSFSDAQGNCYITLERNITISDESTTKVSGINLPSPGGGRAEIGNPNCDNVVNIADLVLLKPGFGKSEEESGYQVYLDFDGNGVIDIADFLVLKKYFGNELSAAPDKNSPLCKP